MVLYIKTLYIYSLYIRKFYIMALKASPLAVAGGTVGVGDGHAWYLLGYLEWFRSS